MGWDEAAATSSFLFVMWVNSGPLGKHVVGRERDSLLLAVTALAAPTA